MNKCQELLEMLMDESLSDVQGKWTPPEGFFNRSAEDVAKGLRDNSKNYSQAIKRLTFYINRAGKNLLDKDKRRLERAKGILRKLFRIKK